MKTRKKKRENCVLWIKKEIAITLLNGYRKCIKIVFNRHHKDFAEVESGGFV